MAFKKTELKQQINKEMHERALEKDPTKPVKKKMKIFPIRFPEEDLLLLENHFSKLNTSLGTGIRRIVAEYMIEKGLR